jgi:transketolase
MRTAFIEQLIIEARKNDKILLLVGDLGFSVVEPFEKEFPNRYINVGICEQNMAGIAGGLAMNGYIVYCYSIGNFPTLRCIEQIRNDIVYYKSNVRIVSVGAGYAYGSQGVSHHATEDIGMLRTLPDMVVCSPSDPEEAKMLTSLSVSYQGPMYIRLGKAGETVFHSKQISNYSIGDLLPIKVSDNSKTVILASGSVLKYAEDGISHGLNYDLYTIPVIKPINKEQLCAIAVRYEQIIVLEEHQKSCGVGSAVIEQLSDAYSEGSIKRFPKVLRKGINDIFYSVVGNQDYLCKLAGLRF